METMLFKKLNLEEIEQLEKGRIIFYTENNGRTVYGGFVNKFGEGFLTNRKYLLINGIDKENRMSKDMIYIDNKELKIYAFEKIVDMGQKKRKEK